MILQLSVVIASHLLSLVKLQRGQSLCLLIYILSNVFHYLIATFNNFVFSDCEISVNSENFLDKKESYFFSLYD